MDERCWVHGDYKFPRSVRLVSQEKICTMFTWVYRCQGSQISVFGTIPPLNPLQAKRGLAVPTTTTNTSYNIDNTSLDFVNITGTGSADTAITNITTTTTTSTTTATATATATTPASDTTSPQATAASHNSRANHYVNRLIVGGSVLGLVAVIAGILYLRSRLRPPRRYSPFLPAARVRVRR